MHRQKSGYGYCIISYSENRVCISSGVAESCSGAAVGCSGNKSLTIGGCEPPGMKNPTRIPAENTPASRINPTNKPSMILMDLFTNASV